MCLPLLNIILFLPVLCSKSNSDYSLQHFCQLSFFCIFLYFIVLTYISNAALLRVCFTLKLFTNEPVFPLDGKVFVAMNVESVFLEPLNLWKPSVTPFFYSLHIFFGSITCMQKTAQVLREQLDEFWQSYHSRRTASGLRNTAWPAPLKHPQPQHPPLLSPQKDNHDLDFQLHRSVFLFLNVKLSTHLFLAF